MAGQARVGFGILVLTLLLVGQAQAQNWSASSKSSAQPAPATKEQNAGTAAATGGDALASRNAAIPNDYKLVMLIKTTIIAVNQANMTGNYTLLRDLGTPDFQRSNNATRLAEAFASLRQRNLDLAPILFITPKLAGPPSLQQNGSIRLTGLIPSSPEQVHFDFAFLQVDGQWMLDGISLAMVHPKAPIETSAAPAAQAAKKR
ncbi:hypothetical protein Rvan_2223 [Rhodomicrobium vannielii ATCC 17100]|uniref:DUF4864 domain-containing protein n=1 Tax=Rhodomicrobium vannielii (strain ATCC 17100 / DSM 162 / LMG 4299 / NCIMB 10020 / ATH 3.1.1) TaxID=648757 RepID=E3I387_RHOVT|nr:hypothetical protein [Rhodomicrobium vannielii]ADP71448.1 hypothetical protein Rvan_2223 [Rhodomicrobium vannielii ATCC 17100]